MYGIEISLLECMEWGITSRMYGGGGNSPRMNWVEKLLLECMGVGLTLIECMRVDVSLRECMGVLLSLLECMGWGYHF